MAPLNIIVQLWVNILQSEELLHGTSDLDFAR
jgi:hypothetical protein